MPVARVRSPLAVPTFRARLTVGRVALDHLIVVRVHGPEPIGVLVIAGALLPCKQRGGVRVPGAPPRPCRLVAGWLVLIQLTGVRAPAGLPKPPVIFPVVAPLDWPGYRPDVVERLPPQLLRLPAFYLCLWPVV